MAYPDLTFEKINYVTNFTDVGEALKSVDNRLVGVDTETTSLDPHTGKLRLISISNKERAIVLDVAKIGILGHELIRHYLSDNSRYKIFHNAKFDRNFIRTGIGLRHMGNIVDTMIISQLLACGDMSLRHNLKEALDRHLGIWVDKAEQRSNWWDRNLTKAQITYSAVDSWYLIPLFETMVKEIRAKGMYDAMILEMNAVEPTAEMEWNGLKIDKDKWRGNVVKTKEKCKESEQAIFYELRDTTKQIEMFAGTLPTFNVNSTPQLMEKLEAVGIELPTIEDKKTGKIKKTTDMDMMKQIVHVHPVIQHVVDYRGFRKMVTSYGENYLHEINQSTGRIHGQYRQIGTFTGRYTDPRLLVIPQDDDFRQCFVAEDSNILVWADYSIIELRILAEFSKDPRMIQAFVEGKDLHTHTASLVFNVPYEKVTKEQRKIAKDLNYAIVYGVGPQKFARRSSISEVESRKIINSYFKAYPSLKIWLNTAARNAVMYRMCRTGSGRMIRFKFDENNSMEVSHVQRNGKNTPIQGTSADILKMALANVYDSIRDTSIMLLHAVHDEVILEGKLEFKSEMREILETEMMNAAQHYLKTVPVKVDVKEGPCWRK